MGIIEQAKYIDHFLRELYNSSFATSLAMGLEMKQIPSEKNKQKFKTLEYILEELELVELVRGRDNSTLGGQCEYHISGKGRELFEKNESSYGLLLQREIQKEMKENPLFDEKEWDKYYNRLLEKRADQADFFLDMIVEKELINLDKQSVRKYFKEWFQENQEFDLQIKNGDLAIEDGDLQTVPDFSEENIPEFLKWFEAKGNGFMDFLKEKGVDVKKGSKQEIINHGNVIINNDSKINEQTISNGNEQKESNWSKANIIIALVVGIATIIGVAWSIWG
ncbi:MAG: hypothetical protein GQ564_19255 [Bacteroidales bacterium]|nr:hypothetical protein [Bacteroidales bacterium]